MNNVEISNSEYLELLLDTAPEHQDLYWCLRTKLQLKKMQNLTGYRLTDQVDNVDKRFNEIQYRNENLQTKYE